MAISSIGSPKCYRKPQQLIAWHHIESLSKNFKIENNHGATEGTEKQNGFENDEMPCNPTCFSQCPPWPRGYFVFFSSWRGSQKGDFPCNC